MWSRLEQTMPYIGQWVHPFIFTLVFEADGKTKAAVIPGILRSKWPKKQVNSISGCSFVYGTQECVFNGFMLCPNGWIYIYVYT